MSNSQFVGTSFNLDLPSPHYINGRLLTAEDLKADQEAILTRLTQLGRASGYGVVEGLTVSGVKGGTSVTVSPGFGLNQQGQIIHLVSEISLPLAPQSQAITRIDDLGRFQDCKLEGTGNGATTPGGAYLLTAVPASRLEGLAPLKTAAGSVDTPQCAAKWELAGLQFKAILLTGFDATGPGVTDVNRRNLLAHWCFGSQALKNLARDPFQFSAQFTGLDQIDSADLTPCDLPLAVFHWTGSALTFVDVWSARRRLVRPAALDAWTGLLSDRRLAAGQARFLQFQNQLELLKTSTLSAILLKDYFRFLPPVCFVPVKPSLAWVKQISGNSVGPLLAKLSDKWFGDPLVGAELLRLAIQKLMAVLSTNGFQLETFLGDMSPQQIGLIDQESIDFTLHHSWLDGAIDLEELPLIRVYVVGENIIGPLVTIITKMLADGLSGLSPVSLVGFPVEGIIADWKQMIADELGGRINLAWLKDDKLLASLGQLYAMVVKKPRPIRWVDLAGAG